VIPFFDLVPHSGVVFFKPSWINSSYFGSVQYRRIRSQPASGPVLRSIGAPENRLTWICFAFLCKKFREILGANYIAVSSDFRAASAFRTGRCT